MSVRGVPQSHASSRDRPNKIGKSIFNFPNGDIYIGHYKLVYPETLTMNGNGMYICNDKTVYIGEWLKNEMIYGKIKFPSGEEYIGNFQGHRFNGKGVYAIPGAGRVIGSFQNNTPVDTLTLVDRNAHIWHGTVDGCSATFHPVNQFLESPTYAKDIIVVPWAQFEDKGSILRMPQPSQ